MAAAASSPLASSVEKTNGAKLSRLLIDGGTMVLRNVFDSHHPPANLAANLNVQYKTLLSLFRRRILNTSQWDKLFPPSGANPDSKTFDITLLFLLLTNICGLTTPPSGWHRKPPSSDTSPEANLARIKFFRNELYGHVTTTGVDTPTFNTLWLEISSVLVALGLNQTEVDRLEAEPCGEDDFLDVLRGWSDSEQDIKSTLRESISKVDELQRIEINTNKVINEARQTQLEDHRTLQESFLKLEGISQTQTETRQVLKEKHETLQAGLQEIKQEVDNLKKRREMDRAEEVLRNLAKSEFQGDIECHAQRFQEGTQEWIFKRVDDWLNDRSSPNRVMVISGSAGMGKSVISSVICKRMQEAGRLSGSHFCQHKIVLYRNPQRMLQSLAFHLSQALPEYKDALVDQLSRNLGEELNSMGVEELFALLFKEPLNKITDPGRNLLVVIDGLDESEYQGRNELLDVIANQFCKLPKWMRFFVTTRPEINIADSLQDFQSIQLEETAEENFRDIQLFFEMQLSQEIEQEHRDVLLRRLVEKSEGVFLYAYFLTDLIIQKNVSNLTPEQLESSLPLGLSSVYLSHFKRLEKELSEELKIDEDQMSSFLCAMTASREPLPTAFVPRLLNLKGTSFSVQRKIDKVIACISSLLPVRDGRLHFFHKSVKDWLTNTSYKNRHYFTVHEQEGHEILFDLCRNELDNIKQKGVHDTQFSDTEKYALQHGVQHMIQVDELGEKLRPCSIEELVCMYVTDLELIYAKLCVNSTSPSEDIWSVRTKHKSAIFNEQNRSLLVSLLNVLRKHAYLLTDHPHLWFQSVINEGSPELSSRAATILENCLPSVPYMKYVDKHKGAVQAKFCCSDTVACFDVSPEMDYMVCECRDGTIHLWFLETGKKEWVRPSLVTRNYESVYLNDQMDSDKGAYREITPKFLRTNGIPRRFEVLTFYRSVVFHPSGKYVLPGTLQKAYNLKGNRDDLFPKSNCTFSHCVSPQDKRTILTDCVDDPTAIVLWSVENGEQLKRRTWNYVISSFAISQDGSHIAFGDVTGSIYLLDVNRWHVKALFEGGDASCGFMYFTPDKKNLVCGYLHYRREDLGYRYAWTQPLSGLPFCYLLQLDSVSIPGDCAWVGPTDFVLWPIDPFDESLGLLCSWVEEVGSVFPFLETGFYKKLNNETALVGSPPFTYVAAVNVDLLTKTNSVSTKQVVTEIEFSSEGDTIYSISRDEGLSQRTNEVLVTVLRMSSQELLKEKTFTEPLLSLEPMKEGVLLCFKHRVPELWDFELAECVRPLARLKGTEKFIRLSDELIACQLPRRRLNHDGIIHDDLLNFGPLSEVEEENSWELHVQDGCGRHDESFNSDGISNKGDSSVLEDDSSDLKTEGDLRDLESFEYFPVLPVDIINVTSGECVSSIKTRVWRYDHIPFILCNRQNQLLVCTSQDIDDYLFDIEELTVSLRNSNSLKPVWEKSTKRYDGYPFTPEFIFSPEEEFLITWGSFDSGSGLHILEAKSGETRHTLLKDQENIVDCKFVGNCDILVCCSRDNFLRLFNVRSGELLSQLDIEEQPYSLGACLGNSLVAVGLSTGARLKFIHVELRRGKNNGMKKGSIVKDK